MNSKRMIEAIERAKRKLLSMPENELQQALFERHGSPFSNAILESGALECRLIDDSISEAMFITVEGSGISVLSGGTLQISSLGLGNPKRAWSTIDEATQLDIFIPEEIDESVPWAA